MINTEWRKIRLGEVISILTDYHANGSYQKLKENVTLYDEPDYAIMIRTTNFENSDFAQELKYIDKHAYNFLSKSKVFPGDILMNKIANAGSVYMMPNLKRPVSLAMNLFLIRVQPEYANHKYIYYYLKEHQDYIKLFAVGTAAKTITKQAVRDLEITLPTLSIQRKIAAILSAYDDLIENNQRRIKILEEIAQNLYREWFVKFRFPGYEKAKFVDSPLGRIPEGWEVKTLGEIAELKKDKFQKELHSKLPLLDLAKMNQHTLYVGETGNPNELTSSRIIFKKDDILFGSIRPYLHKVALAPCQGVTNVSVFVIQSIDICLQSFLTVLLSSIETIRWADQHSTGTKMPVIKWEALQRMPVIMPEQQILKEFQTLIYPMIQTVKIAYSRNRTLRRTRDLLLPKLISGEVDVSELDIKVLKEVSA